MLEDAIILACNAHRGQKRKSGEPFIKHPLRVMMKMETEEEQVVAVLHDILEDTATSKDRIQGLFGRKVAEAVTLLLSRISLLSPSSEAYLIKIPAKRSFLLKIIS